MILVWPYKHLYSPSLIKAEKKHCAHGDHQSYFFFFSRFLLFRYVFQTACFSHISWSSRHPMCFPTDTRRAALPPQKAALSHDQNRHTIKYCWHPHTKQKPVRHFLCAAYKCYYSIVSQFCQSFVHFSKYLYFLG